MVDRWKVVLRSTCLIRPQVNSTKPMHPDILAFPLGFSKLNIPDSNKPARKSVRMSHWQEAPIDGHSRALQRSDVCFGLVQPDKSVVLWRGHGQTASGA